MRELLPCPFCGEKLVEHDDHHGTWWAHRSELGDCPISVHQIFDERDAEEWNKRAPASAPASLSRPDDEGKEVKWPNGCNETVPRALRYLAENERPYGRQKEFNWEHLYRLADEIEQMASRPLYAAPAPATLQEIMEENRKLRERLGPRGLEVIEIGGAGHYVNEKVKAEIVILRHDRENLSRRVSELRGGLADAWQGFREKGHFGEAGRIEAVMPDLKTMADPA
ncbi:Lar family restriction alleviation protein [Bradyrhizobium sp. Leo121]|uniref:Lar family restriction alleviation protein n=1 Tax=Bradyrhizobium sp. Leo121 TaxID=1571195 RepID=UPI0010291345|nr:Lar family restriction alleviation protein [Bradyrhizobium sp. Leo121]